MGHSQHDHDHRFLLLFATGGVAWEAVRRLGEPAPVESKTVMSIAAIGVAVNLASNARKELINRQLQTLRTFQFIVQLLGRSEQKKLPREVVLGEFARHLPSGNPEQLFETMVGWARYAETNPTRPRRLRSEHDVARALLERTERAPLERESTFWSPHE